MPLFYPDIDFSRLSKIEKAGDHAERKILKALNKLDNSWHIFHAIGWRTCERYGERTGEVDLIIFNPDYGILFVEIKGGGIKLESGTWYYQDALSGETRAKMKMSPSEQAARSRYYFQPRLAQTSLGSGILKKTAFTHTAWFPDIEWNAPYPPEIPNGSYILDARHLEKPEKAIITILKQSYPDAEKWTQHETGILIKSIAPEINLMPPLGTVISNLRAMLFRMTDNQINALYVLKNMKRLLIEGCAGSGKTLLAVRLAHEHLHQGKKVLFTCFNKNLAAYISREFEQNDNIDVLNFHELVRKRCEQFGIPHKVPQELELRQDFFRNRCPELLEQTICMDNCRYDSIIVDEAFDFLDTWWIALEGLGLPACSMYAFYDTNQGVFNNKEEWQPPFKAETIYLDTNLRNTFPVGDIAYKIGKINERIICTVNEGPKPEIIAYSGTAEMINRIENIIETLTKKQKIRHKDIVILTPYKYNSIQVGMGELVADSRKPFTTDISSPPEEGKIRVGTIQAFKGLEADVVIFCGIDGKLRACKTANLYVGASRARTMLYLLHEKTFNPLDG